MSIKTYPIFSVTGIEVEYMIVSKTTLDVLPISDKILKTLSNDIYHDINMGLISLSNELVMHVIEFKTSQPIDCIEDIEQPFYNQVSHTNKICSYYDAMLLPTGAHPWMNPESETKLWPYGNRKIYNAYDKIFGCKGHGWSNLQSTHINLPFQNDEEFASLHQAIRYILPIIPALTASTPLIDGALTGNIDSRLTFYKSNQQKIPAISGELIPEPITSQAQYQQNILQPMYDAIRDQDPSGILQHEWLNSRAAIARFDRHAIEIRIVDTQECMLADIGCILLICEVIKTLSTLPLPDMVTSQLKSIYQGTVQYGSSAEIDNLEYLQGFDPALNTPMTASGLWQHLLHHYDISLPQRYRKHLEIIFTQGNLSERIIKAIGNDVTREKLKSIYLQLANCLHTNESFSQK